MMASNIAAKFLTIGALALVALPANLVGGQFKRFPDTVSPDGARALAWGPVAEQKSDVASFTEVPYEDEALDQVV